MENKFENIGKLISRLIFEENIENRKILGDMVFDSLQEHLEDDKKFLKQAKEYQDTVKNILLK